MIKVEVANIFKSFDRPDGNLRVLEDISIELGENEFVSIIGPSGCGKSTLLRTIAGLLEIDKGKINIDGEISYLRQNSSLMPWRNILDNVLLPIEIQTGKKPKYTDELIESFNEFGLAGFEKSMPGEISGGMAKRAALLRTYLEDRDILLLDEPFSSLDAITRKTMGRWLLEVWNKHRKSVLFVTHDIEEALLLSDKIYIMDNLPSKILETVVPAIGRPRNPEAVYEKQFVDQRKHIEDLLI
jgi:ABC-type nitrate/sulfonate/bicarbonate transport system ATPase subunit